MLPEEAGAVSNFQDDKKTKIKGPTTQLSPKGAAGGCWWGEEGNVGVCSVLTKVVLNYPGNRDSDVFVAPACITPRKLSDAEVTV